MPLLPLLQLLLMLPMVAAAGAPHPMVFKLGTHLHLGLTGIALAALVGITILFETGLERIEKYAKRVSDSCANFLNKMLRELTLFGFVGFFAFLIEQAYPAFTSLAFYLPWEFAHIAIFVTAVVYIAQSFYFLFMMNTFNDFLDHCERYSAKEAFSEQAPAPVQKTQPRADDALATGASRLRREQVWFTAPCCLGCLHMNWQRQSSLLGGRAWLKRAQFDCLVYYKCMRILFMRSHKGALAPLNLDTKRFDLPMYLCSAVTEGMMHNLVHIQVQSLTLPATSR
jgi:hypothetical protein